MARQLSCYQTYGHFVVRGNWRKEAWIVDELHPHGILADVTPAPGRTYTRATLPRGRGRGESLTSPRRLAAKLKAVRALQLRQAGYSWTRIARALGYKDKSGPWRCVNRTITRVEWDKKRAQLHGTKPY